jgi:hypothetical protein
MPQENLSSVLFKLKFFELRYSGAIGKDMEGVKLVARYPSEVWS